MQSYKIFARFHRVSATQKSQLSEFFSDFTYSDNPILSEHSYDTRRTRLTRIDRMFADAGWAVVDRDQFSPEDSAVAVVEGLMTGNLEADYLLFINGKAVGV